MCHWQRCVIVNSPNVSSIAFFTALALLQRKIAVDSKYPRATSVVFNIWGGLIAIILFLVTGAYKNISLPTAPSAWFIMIFAFAMYAMYERGRFWAAKLLDASILAIISNFGLAVAFIGSIFLYSESFSMVKIVGTLLIIVSLLLVTLVKKIDQKISVKGVVIAIIIYTFLGIGWMLDKKGALLFNPNVYTLFGWIIPIFLIYFPYVKTKELVHEAKLGSWRIILLAGLNVVGYYLQLRALTLGEATKVIPLVQTFTLATVVLGILILGEKQYLWRKVIAAVIGLGGAYLLVTA